MSGKVENLKPSKDQKLINDVSKRKPEYSKSLTKKSHRWTYSVPRTGCDIIIKSKTMFCFNIINKKIPFYQGQMSDP